MADEPGQKDAGAQAVDADAAADDGRGPGHARADQGELSLRAAADEAGEPRFLVDLGEGEPVERTIGELLDQFGRDDAAIEAAKKCL